MKSKTEKLGMDKLENVSGGSNFGANWGDKNCWFEPASPTSLLGEGATMRALCKSMCSHGCGCHGTNSCINKMHIIAHTKGDQFAYPAPKKTNNHSEHRKKIEMPT